jgi:hypothetical protein
MSTKIQNNFSNFQSSFNAGSFKKKALETPKSAAKKLANESDLDMYFKPRPNVNACNHAVAVVAAVAAIIAAANGAIEAAKRGRTIDTLYPIDLENTQVSGLDVNQLLKIRENGI